MDSHMAERTGSRRPLPMEPPPIRNAAVAHCQTSHTQGFSTHLYAAQGSSPPLMADDGHAGGHSAGGLWGVMLCRI